ncbi:hypothetical protein JCM8547_005874 [Rhodosporidiobolus lusitaniae]
MSTVLAGAAPGAPQADLAHAGGILADYWTALLALLGLCLLAYLTNPNAASFRTHLTSQSFHTHLRRLSSSPSRSPSASSRNAQGSSGTAFTATKDGSNAPASATTTSHGKRKASGSSASDRPGKNAAYSSSASSSANRHILSFSNRISLSIKTPSYRFTSYYLFSAVYVPPSRPSGPPGTTKRQQQQLKQHPELGALLGLGGELWFGVFGKWYALKLWENEVQEEEERRGRLERGVKEMVVEDDDKDADFPSTAPSASASASGSSTPAHTLPSSSLDRSSSITSQHNADPPLSPTSKNAPGAARLAKRVFRAGQRRSSPTSLTRLKTKAEHAAREAAVEAEKQAADDAASASSPASSVANGLGGANGSAGAGKTGTTDPVLLELQAQLDELRATAADGEKRLQEELEVLRGKKRDEDTFRTELKGKTKTLEEAKRAAEAARVEAEKELGERKGVIKDVQGRVDKLREEIRALERKGMEVVERKEKKKRDRREREKKLRDDVGKKRDELKDKEKGLDDVLHKVGEMERKLEVRRALLVSRRTELAQFAATGVRPGPPNPPPPAPQPVAAAANPNNGGLYSIAPPPGLPATATLGGVGAIANAFAVPFGQGQYGRRNYPYVHPLSANSSRPTSIRSGHFDPLTGAFQSAPSSPTLGHPVLPHDEALAQYAGDASGWPSSFAAAPSGTAGVNGASQPLPHSGFLEHRLQHRAANASTDDLPSHFLPFDFDSLANGSDPSPPLRTNRAGSLTATNDNSPGIGLANKPRAPLALPLQYLDSGLLANPSSISGVDSPGLDTGPLSPMTPHQASLIPSQLFHMLDEDDDDDGLFVMPDSPTLRGANLGADWAGLGLGVDELGGSRRNSGSEEFAAAAAVPPPVAEQDEDEGEEQFEEAVERKDSPVVVSPRAETFSLVLGGNASATSSPIGPPPASPYSPWDTTAANGAAPSAIGGHLVSSASTSGLEPPPSAAQAAFHRLSPSQDLTDDLPRAGLSLNPDAKAFAFPFTAGAAHARTSSVPSPPTLHAAVGSTARSARSGTTSSFPGSALPSPTTLAPPLHPPSSATSSVFANLAVDPPTKSRMEFANRSSLDQPVSARLSPGIDWPRPATNDNSSPKFGSSGVAPIGTAAPGSNSGGGSGRSTPVPSAAILPVGSGAFNPFNPFDSEDELLGPLRK